MAVVPVSALMGISKQSVSVTISIRIYTEDKYVLLYLMLINE